MGKNNKWILVVLVLLTVGSYLFSEQSGAFRNIGLLILFVFLKVFLVAFYFMELKKAHVAWPIVLGLIFIVYAAFIFALN